MTAVHPGGWPDTLPPRMALQPYRLQIAPTPSVPRRVRALSLPVSPRYAQLVRGFRPARVFLTGRCDRRQLMSTEALETKKSTMHSPWKGDWRHESGASDLVRHRSRTAWPSSAAACRPFPGTVPAWHGRPQPLLADCEEPLGSYSVRSV